MSKITNIPSEIRNFFSEKRRSMVMDTFTRLLESLNLDIRSLGGQKRENFFWIYHILIVCASSSDALLEEVG